MLVRAWMIALSAVYLLVLSACVSSPPVRYYSLSPIYTDYQQDPDDAVMLGIGPLSIPDYLNRSQIVTRDVDAQMRVDDFSRWTEPLADSMHRTISTDVDNLLHGVVVVMYPYDAVVRSHLDYRLVGDVNRFDADSSGLVVLEIQWAIVDTEANLLVPARRNRYQAQMVTSGDFGAMVAAMNDVLSQFSRDVAGRLKAASQN